MDLIPKDNMTKKRELTDMVERNAAVFDLIMHLIDSEDFDLVRQLGQTLIGAHPSMQQSFLVMARGVEDEIGHDLINLLEERMHEQLDRETSNQYIEIPINDTDGWDASEFVMDALQAHGTKCSREEYEEHYVIKYNVFVRELE